MGNMSGIFPSCSEEDKRIRPEKPVIKDGIFPSTLVRPMTRVAPINLAGLLLSIGTGYNSRPMPYMARTPTNTFALPF